MVEDKININCSYIPPEIITAYGYEVNRIWPNEIGDKGRNLLPANYCPYSRAFLSEIIGDSKKTILVNSCDAMRRVYDTQSNKAYLLQVPRIKNNINIIFYKKKLLEISLSLASNKVLSEDIIKNEIREFNEVRYLIKKLRDKILENSNLSFSILIDILNKDYYKKNKRKLKDLIKEFETTYQEQDKEYSPRIIISSSCLLDKTLINKVENTGMEVVALDSCQGERTFDFKVENNSDDLIKDLARSYLNKKACPRMMKIDKRLTEVKNLIFQRKADGLIYFIPKFCDQASYDFKYIKKWSEQNNFPILKLEGEYQAGKRGQLTTRIEAFKESLKFSLDDEG